MTSRPSPSRIVVRPPNWLGDAVLALPAIAAVRRAHPSAHLTIAAIPAVAPLFREDTDAHPDRVIDLPRATRDAVAALEGGGFDAGLLLPNSFRSAFQFWRAGIPERWGYRTAARRLLLTRPIARPRARVHQADFYRHLVESLGMPAEPGEQPRVAARSPSLERAVALIVQHGGATTDRIVGFAPGAAYGQAKQWPPDRVGAVAAQVARRYGVTCVIVGATHDRPAARAVESWVRAHAPDMLPRVVDLTGRTSLGALVGLIPRMTAFVSNDSGAMHLAAALGRPVVALFGPTDERVTAPLGDHDIVMEPVFCRPCLLRDCPIDHRCMKRISADRVSAVLAARLDAAGVPLQ
jgi:heptosyltransferase-2